MERRPAGHRPHREDLHLGPLVTEIDPGFIPVNLGFLRPTVALRHERLPSQQTHLVFAFADVIAHRRFSDRSVRELGQDAAIKPTSGVALLARSAPVRIQHFIDKRYNQAELRLDPLRVAMLRRQRVANRLTHQAPMNAELRGDTRDRPDPKLMLPTKLLEQVHFGSPVHARSPDPVGRP
jgi:hypothetical protein